MKKYIYTAGAFALAFAAIGAPVAAFAESGSDDGQTGVRVNAEVMGQVMEKVMGDASTSGAVRVRAEMRYGNESSSTEAMQTREEMKVHKETEIKDYRENDANTMRLFDSLRIRLESTTTPVTSLAQLRLSIKERLQELDQEEASSSPKHRNVLKDANPVRLAVHALLASQDLLGGIGQQVSEIARQMNDSVASTTSAEARIESRGFFARLFFGGDKNAATTIDAVVEKNQQRIDALTALLAQADISADLKVTLQAQITALQEVQVKLKALAAEEQGAWGLFSWRFSK